MRPYFDSKDNIATFHSLHVCTVKDVKDEDGRFRVRVECPELLGTGKKQWSAWCEVVGLPWGTNESDDGDQGLMWAPEPGQGALLGFLGGDALRPYVQFGPPVQQRPGRNVQLTPKEERIAGERNPRDATRIRAFKDAAGNTILMDSRGRMEKLLVMDWAGAGLISSCPGKVADTPERKGEGSKPRAGLRRETRSVADGTQYSPDDMRDGQHVISLLGLQGQGINMVSTSGAPIVSIGIPGGPSIILDGQNNRIILTAGASQQQLLADGRIRTTPQIIRELDEPEPVEPLTGAIAQVLENEWKEFNESSVRDIVTTA